jgi:hypothetical protein
MKQATIVLAVLSLAILGISQAPKDERIAVKNGALDTAPASSRKNNQQHAASPPSQTIAIYNQSSSPEHNGDAKQSQDAIDVERQVAKFTGYLAIVGLFQLLVLAVQAVLFFQQKKIMGQHKVSLEKLATAASDNAIAAKDSADALKAADRAWILAKPYLPDKLLPVGEHRVTRFMWSIKSVGRTPARIIETDAVIWRVADMTTIPAQPRYEGDRPMILSNFLLVPKDSIPIYWMIEPAGQGLSMEEVSRIREGTLTLFAYGFVRYCDVYASPHLPVLPHLRRPTGWRRQNQRRVLCVPLCPSRVHRERLEIQSKI